MRQREGRRPCPDSENAKQANFVVPKARKGTGDPPFCPECLAEYKLSGDLKQAQRRGIFRFPDKWTLSPTAPTPSPRSNLLIRVALVPRGPAEPKPPKSNTQTPPTHHKAPQQQQRKTNTTKNKEKHQTPSRATEPSRANTTNVGVEEDRSPCHLSSTLPSEGI